MRRGIGKNDFKLTFDISIDVNTFRRLKICRRDYGRAVRMITGYSFNNAFLYKIGCKTDPSCDCGFEFFWACPRIIDPEIRNELI